MEYLDMANVGGEVPEKCESVGMIRNPIDGKMKNGNQTTNQMGNVDYLRNSVKASTLQVHAILGWLQWGFPYLNS